MKEPPACSSARVAVATGNRMKVIAVQKAFTYYCDVSKVYMVRAPDWLPRQPRGSEVFAGALARAMAALSSGADFGVGVEAGPLEFYTTTGWLEVQVAVIAGPGKRVSVGVSQGFELPPGIAEKVALEGIELAEAVGEKRPGDLGEGVGYIGVLTRGYVTRSDLTLQAVLMALTPWISGWWRSLARAEELASQLGSFPGNL